MRNRTDILRALVDLERPVSDLRRELAAFAWDSQELIRLEAGRLKQVLEQYLSGRLSAETVSEWADALEGRDDVGCIEKVRDVVAELASPDINGSLTKHRASELMSRLEHQ